MIAYGRPFDQILSLDPLDPPSERNGGGALRVGEFLRRALAKGGTP